MTEKITHQKFYFHLGDVMRHMRKNSGISKTKMAAIIGVSVPKYIAMEEGMGEISTYDLYLFACALNVGTDTILSLVNVAIASDE